MDYSTYEPSSSSSTLPGALFDNLLTGEVVSGFPLETSGDTDSHSDEATELVDPVESPLRRASSSASRKASRDVTDQPPEAVSGGASSIALSQWTSEILSLFVAICCIVALFTTLAIFSGQKQPRLPYDNVLNLSTLVALLATVFRSMIENVLGSG
ncbi:hypothetical protein PG985_011100 [Apiospora marii]|uniref:uncharacterized protein n=1 Tax=Apiospora marii TaxID=335849 RepID=UPI00312F32B2